MPEEVIFESEERLSRGDIAAHLRAVASKLDAGEPLTLDAGGQSVTLDVPADATFEVKAERETSAGPSAPELSVEFELEWREGETEAGTGSGLSVE